VEEGVGEGPVELTEASAEIRAGAVGGQGDLEVKVREGGDFLNKAKPLKGGYRSRAVLEGPNKRNLAQFDDPQRVGRGARRFNGELVGETFTQHKGERGGRVWRRGGGRGGRCGRRR